MIGGDAGELSQCSGKKDNKMVGWNHPGKRNVMSKVLFVRDVANCDSFPVNCLIGAVLNRG